MLNMAGATDLAQIETPSVEAQSNILSLPVSRLPGTNVFSVRIWFHKARTLLQGEQKLSEHIVCKGDIGYSLNMADRILAAIDLMDTHNKPTTFKNKQRALGDIDGKYSLADQLLDIYYYPTLKSDVALAGVKKINPANDKSVDEIVEQDREKMVQSAERARSAPSPYKENSVSTTRPMTSSSWATVSAVRDTNRIIESSIFALPPASHTSIKRLSFTSPAVHLGPSDARDEVMDEIVNKPLVYRRNQNQSQSAPVGGRMSSRCVRSSGKRSVRWIKSSNRARTSLHRNRRGNKWEKSAGPFMTVKVSGKDLWVVSDSTPTSYFNNDKDDGLREVSGRTGTKLPKWEQAADAVPKEEKSSLPRHERLLGAPAQFTPSVQWLRYDPDAPIKKPPVLTPFKNSFTDGAYYNIESTVTNRVKQHLHASPGVRVARNGAVVSHSLKLEKGTEPNPELGQETSYGEEGEESEVDVTALLPSRISEEINKYYESKQGESDDDNSKNEINDNSDAEVSDDKLMKNGNEADDILENAVETFEDENQSESEESSLSSVSQHVEDGRTTGNENVEAVEGSIVATPLLTEESLALLTKLTGNHVHNPLLATSNTSATSCEESMDSHDLNEYIAADETDFKLTRTHGDVQDDVWAMLESQQHTATPRLWTSKSKLEKMILMKRIRRRLKVEPTIAKTDKPTGGEQTNKVILPLCWSDELAKADAKIVEVKNEETSASQNEGEEATLPVVFHKFLRHDGIPSVPPSLVGHTPTWTVSLHSPSPKRVQCVDLSQRHSKGYRAPVSTPRSNRSVRSKSASTASPPSTCNGWGGSAPHSIVNGSEFVRQSLDLADLLRVTPDSFPSSSPQVTTHTVRRERVKIVHDGNTEQETDVVRNVSAENMESRILGDECGKNYLLEDGTKAENNPSQLTETKNTPVGTINLSVLEIDNMTNEPTTMSSRRRSDHRSGRFTTPQNTPKSPSTQRLISTPKNSPTKGSQDPARAIMNKDSLTEDLEQTLDSSGKSNNVRDEPPVTASQIKINPHQAGVTGQASARKPGFASVTSTQNRLKSGSGRMSSHLGTAFPAVNDKGKSPKSPSLATIIGINDPDAAPPTALPVKSADFIQITQSLHIADRPMKEGFTAGGSKMYNSYMRELTAQGNGNLEVYGFSATEDAKGVIHGRGLGGTSGKPSGFASTHSLKRNPPSYRGSSSRLQNQNHSVLNISPFTPQAGRRSGLAMVPQEKPNHQASMKPGPFGMGIKGDQVRLNIDKNIHNIYRDLGLLKNANSGTKSENLHARSHLSSARSRSPRKEESVISIPTASEASGVTASVPNTVRPSSSKPSVLLQDSQTQWSGRKAKEASPVNEFLQPDSPVVETDYTKSRDHGSGSVVGAEIQERTPEADGRLPIPEDSEFVTESTKVSKAENTGDSGIHPVPDEEHTLQKTSPEHASDRTLFRVVSQSSDGVSLSESHATGNSRRSPTPIHRSASETLLDRLAELGDQASDTTEEEDPEGLEAAAVKGVTMVTVNIAESKEK